MRNGGTVANAMLIAAPSATKNQSTEHKPKLRQTKQWHFGADAALVLVHAAKGRADSVNDLV